VKSASLTFGSSKSYGQAKSANFLRAVHSTYIKFPTERLEALQAQDVRATDLPARHAVCIISVMIA